LMTEKQTPESVFKEYEKAVDYNKQIGLYENVEKNQDFFLGDQWRHLAAPDLEKPVLNFIKRVITYFIAMLVSDDVAVSLTPFRPDEKQAAACKILEREIRRVMERTGFKAKCRELLKNCAVDGDGDFYLWLDPESGDIQSDPIDNTKVLFGNPYVADVQAQRYILIVQRMQLAEARKVAEEKGKNPDEVRPDGEHLYYGEDMEAGDHLVTVVTRLWKQDGTVRFLKATRDLLLQGETDTGYRRYPVCHMMWERVKASYHGRSPVTGLIPNQVFINKVWAMAMCSVKNLAFPKIIYDENKIEEWDNAAGRAIAVAGDPNEAIATGFRAPDFSDQALVLVDRTISYTKDFMGASDAALGNVKPDNTSAIIAVQRASSAPLELQRLAFYQLVEDWVRVVIDMIRADYGVRHAIIEDAAGQQTYIESFDFSEIDLEAMEVNVDVGAASYWSELSQITTMDNLLAKGVIADAVTYLEAIPDHMIKNKSRLIEKLKEQQAAQQQAMGGEMPGGGMPGGM